MDSNTFLKWIPAISIGLSLLITVIGIAASWAVNNRRWVEVDKLVEKYNKYHGQHFEATNDHGAVLRGMDRAINEHEKRDDERFSRIEAMAKETRDDIKEILRAVGPGR